MSEAYRIGREAGRAAGSWVFDGNTDEATYNKLIEGFDAGDPIVLDLCPSPLSGEWAGESIPELSEATGLDLTDDDIATEYEQGFDSGFWAEVIETATYQTERVGQ